jgi:arylsulfatase A-like enzyme
LNLIVLVLDSLRQDHVSAYNQGEPVFDDVAACKTPNMDKFAENAVLFDNMYAEALPTIPARAALLTGNRTLINRPWSPLGKTDVALPQIASLEGYVNGLASDVYHYRAGGMTYHEYYHSYQWVRGQEYDPYRSQPSKRNLDDYVNENYDELWRGRVAQFLTNTDDFDTAEKWFAPQVTELTANWLKANRVHPKVNFWMDCFDPHEPWDPPAEFDTYTDPDYTGPRLVMPMGGEASSWASPAEIRHIRGLYAGETAAVDDALGRVFATLEEEGYYDDSVVVLMGDHGHPLADHGKFLKGADRMYNELLKVPFMIRLPKGRQGGRRVTALAQYHDVLPTVLDYMGLAGSIHDMHGSSLRPVIEGETDEHRETVLVGYHEGVDRCIRNKRWSLIVRPTDEMDELYDLENDPQERNNLIAHRGDVVADLRDRYGAIYFQMGRPGEARNHGQVSEGENVLGVQGAYEMSSGMTP